MTELVEIARIAQQLALQFKTIIELVILAAVFIVVCRVLHIDIPTFITTLVREIREMLALKPTIGAFNAVCLLLLIVGIVVVALVSEFEHLMQLFAAVIGKAKAKDYLDGALELMLFVLVAFASFSVWCVMKASGQGKARARRR